MKIGFERGEARLGAVKPLLSGVGGRDTDFGERRRLLDQLFDRSLVEIAQRCPFLLDNAFEILQAVAGAFLHTRTGIPKLVEVRFELTDRPCVTVRGGVPPPQNAGAVFGKAGQPLFERSDVVVGSVTQVVDLRLQTRETLLKSDSI